ncbi:unnamed protein product [Acanthoscelides obtectus]|uniref:PH domain-containing protein n=1 Tax=Acanthoscelides obtectus TaxID=200917 RepID=A0A9P0KPM6_ACAOB|nr:unnamed protein product [Acanthoscelides obtectus]CAK1678297.1 Anillin [Acanthoscelides obtectus]
MDAFTENILARARERQKLLENYPSSDKLEKTPLKDSNLNMACSQSQANLTDIKTPQRIHKESVSDSCINVDKDLEIVLKENKSESALSRFQRQNSKTRISSEIAGSPNAKSNTLNIQRDNFNMEIKVTSSDDVRVEVEIAGDDFVSNKGTGSNGSENVLRDESKNKLKRLGKLYAGGDEVDISSPIHRTEAKFYACEENEGQPSSETASKGLRKLAHLAQTINQWEDDVRPLRGDNCSTATTPKKAKAPAPPLPSGTTNSPQKTTPPRHNKPKAPQPPVIHKETLESYKAPQSPKNASAQWISNSTTEKSLLKGHEESPVRKLFGRERSDKDKGSESDEAKTLATPRTLAESPKKTQAGSQKIVSSLKKDDNKGVVKSTPKQLKWDEEVLSRLEKESQQNRMGTKMEMTSEAQQPVASKVKLLANALNEKVAMEEEEKPTRPKFVSNTVLEKKETRVETAMKKDPALLSVSERKALFEKNQGHALVPKAAFGMAHACKVESVMKACSTKIMNDGAGVKTTQPPMSPTPKASQTTRQIETVKPLIHSSAKPTPPPLPPASKATPTPTGGLASKMAALLENKTTISQEQIENSMKAQRQKEMDLLLNRFHRSKEVSENTSKEAPVIQEMASDESDDEVDATEQTAMLKDRPPQVIGASSKQQQRRSGEKRKPYSKGDSPKVAAVLEDVKRIKVSPAKEGRLYPSLSDIEAATETETDQTRTPTPNELGNQQDSSFEDNYDSDDPNTSFGRDILEAVCKNQTTPAKRPVFDESTASDISSILDDIDTTNSQSEEDNCSGPSPPKQVRQYSPEKTVAQPSNSFNYKNFSPNVKTSPNKFASPVKIMATPQKPTNNLPEYIVEGDNVMPLIHSVSFYRKQQNQVSTPPVRQIIRQPVIEEVEPKKGDDSEAVRRKTAELQEEVNKQQNIISQTSQALNLCMSTPEFSGSTEQVEAEKVLLVATHRRQAALHELQRLRVEKTIRPQLSYNLPIEKGTLSISNIVLPLKAKYVKALAAAGGKGHHVVCLVKCGDQVVPTKLVSTCVQNAKNPDTELSIPGVVVLNDIYSDFTVTFEVYCLQAQEEFLPHEVKYHIQKKSGGKLVTPKKGKQDSRMVMPVKESPAGPQAVRTSSFAMMGYMVFSVQAINKKVWTLNNTPPMSPLEGTVEMRISCEMEVSVEHRGFLTMFDDVSGFGAWHRRWSLLKGHLLSYWKYPDDEKKMPPIDTIDLKNCITKEVGPVSRDVCARMHTFLIERERAISPNDKDSLVIICKGDKTIIRHLLSADTKEERIEWCQKINAALIATRMWGNRK